MQTKTYTVYNFEELSESAKEKAIEWAQGCLREGEAFSECVLDEWKEKLDSCGFSNAQISYCGFWSQGDGASFTAKIDILKWLTANKMKSQNKELVKFLKTEESCISGDIVRNSHHYSHEYTVSVELEGHLYNDVPDKVTKQVDALYAPILENVRALSRKIYKELESEYTAYTSKEEAISMIEANQYTFDEFGNRED